MSDEWSTYTQIYRFLIPLNLTEICLWWQFSIDDKLNGNSVRFITKRTMSVRSYIFLSIWKKTWIHFWSEMDSVKNSDGINFNIDQSPAGNIKWSSEHIIYRSRISCETEPYKRSIHTDNSFRNHVNPNQIWIAITIFQ